MRSMTCARSWHSFDDPHRHLLLMMDFDCPLAFRHKKGEYFQVLRHLQRFLFLGGDFFCQQSLWRLDCIQVLHFVFTFLALDVFLLGYSFQGELNLLFHMFLVSLLIDLYLCCYSLIFVFILCFVKSRIYFVYLYFPYMCLCILFSVSGKIQVDSIKLMSTLVTDEQQL